MFFQDTPPDTSAYMIAGYTVFSVVTAIYLLSLFVRSRNLQRDLTALESLEQEDRPAPAKGAAAGPRAARTNKPKAAAPKRRTGAKNKTKK